MANRPLGITIICILGFIGAILLILGGIALLGLGGLGVMAGSELATLFGGFLGIIGVIILLLGIVTAIALFWLWQMKKIGWTLTMVMEIIGIVLSLVQMQIISIIIPAIIVIYLWMKKDLFK